MKKKCNIYVTFMIVSYAMKTVVDAVMYFYTIFNKNDIYYDDLYLLTPQIISTILITFFYNLYFNDKFYGKFIKASTATIMALNVVYAVLLILDRSKGYVFYFSLVAAINFLNALHLKCNIVPARKPGSIEYGPVFFEILSLIVMILSIYAMFCGFPLSYNKILSMWNYYDVLVSLKINIASSALITVEYLLCRRNDCEYVRDNMVDDSFIVYNLTDNTR